MNKANQARQARIAAILWERLVDAFNEEAKTYDAEHPDSPLGSVGDVYCREVCRPNWWKALGGEELIGSKSENRGVVTLGKGKQEGFDDYWEITHLIEEAHHGEHLETGIIYFGS